MSAKSQLGLFQGASRITEEVRPHEDEAAHAIASELPSWLRFGTSSWSFPGWANILYAGSPTVDALAHRGLAAYAKHPLMRTVGIDRTYYAPIDAADLASYAAQLPPDFPAVVKVWNEVTTYAFADHPKNGSRAGELNPHFLDADLAKETFVPYAEAFADHLGALLFELPPIPPSRMPSDDAFTNAIDRLLRALPSQVRYAFELRTPALVTPRYLATLRDHGAAHVFNAWTAMPSIAEQLAIPGVFTSDVVIARVMLPPGQTYEAMKREMEPFDRIVAPREDVRADVAKLVRMAEAARAKNVYVLVGNKIEGCAPLTVRAFAERIARERQSAHLRAHERS